MKPCYICQGKYMTTRLIHIEALFKALADATRLRILALLVGGEICVCEIHAALKLPQPAVSRHLAYLRNAGLVDTRREGLWVHYRMAVLPDAVLETVHRTVTHALRHLEVVRKDVERLQKRTGCCLPSEDRSQPYACCGEPHQAEASTAVAGEG